MAQNKFLPLANEIADKYCETHQVKRDFISVWYSPEEKAAFVALNSILVIVGDDGKGDPEAEVQILISPNIAASPAVICLESAFAAKYFGAVATAIHCINPETQEIANGEEPAWEMYYELERQKASSLVQQMVQNVADQKEGQADEVETEQAPLDL